MRATLACVLLAALSWSAASTASAALVCGDLNGDLVADSADRNAAESYLYFDGPAPAVSALADVNGDLVMNAADLSYLVSYFNFSGPPLYCYVVEQQFHGQILAQIGQILEDTTTIHDPASKYLGAGSLFGQISLHMQNLHSEGIPLDPGAIGVVENLRTNCLDIGFGIQSLNWPQVEGGLLNFRDNFHEAYHQPGLMSLDPGLVTHFTEVDGDVGDLADIVSDLANPAGLPDHYRSLDSMYALGGPALDAIGNTLLAIADPEMREWLGLTDPEVRNMLDSIWVYVGEPEVVDWMTQANTNAEALHLDMMTKGLNAGTVYLGYDLRLGGEAMLFTPPVLASVGTWTDEDCVICTNRNCAIKEVAVVNWRSSCKGEKAKRGLLKVAKKIKKPPKLPVGDAPLKDLVIEAVETLQKALLEAEPGVRVCVKAQWEHCENVEGWFCTVKRWVAKESDWIEVKGPGLLDCWPSPSKWGTGSTKADIEQGIQDALNSACGS